MELLENNWGKVRCPYCDSVMKPDKEDIHQTIDDGNYIICPVCNCSIWFNDKYTKHPVISRILKGLTIHK